MILHFFFFNDYTRTISMKSFMHISTLIIHSILCLYDFIKIIYENSQWGTLHLQEIEGLPHLFQIMVYMIICKMISKT